MQTRDYDDRIYVSSIEGFRQVNNMHDAIDLKQETNGYCNMYADGVAVSYLHCMKEPQLNAIHFFEDHYQTIFEALLTALSEKFTEPKRELGFSSVNILNDESENMCFTMYTFIDIDGNKVKIKMFKDQVI